jgi:hypothetical protein
LRADADSRVARLVDSTVARFTAEADSTEVEGFMAEAASTEAAADMAAVDTGKFVRSLI